MSKKPFFYQRTILVYLIFTLISCENKITEMRNDYLFSINHSNYNVFLDYYTSNFEMASQYLPDWRGTEAFAFLNRKNNQIKIYNLNTGLLTDSIQYQNDGPNGVGSIYEFHIHNEDSVFLNAKYSYNIFLIDKLSNIVNSYSLIPEDVEFDVGGIPKGTPTALVLMPVWHRPVLIDHFLYINSSPDRDPMKPDYYDSHELMLRLNLENGKYEYLTGYPDRYKGKIWGVDFGDVYSAYNNNDGSFVLSFPLEDYVYETKDFKSFEKHVFRSSLVSEVKPMSKPTKDFSIYYKYFKDNSAYGTILYDPNNKFYFRIGNLQVHDNDYREPTDALSNPQDFTIIVSDDSFKLLHEEKFRQPSHGQYVPRMSFVNDSGLNIAFVDYNNEDKLTFVNFNLVENETNEDF